MSRIFKYLIFLFVACLLLVIIAETGARVAYCFYYQTAMPLLYGIKYTNLGSIIREKQTRRKEKWKGTRNPRMLEVSKKIMVRNSYGFVGPEFPVRKPPGVYRIVAMGGSTTAGFIDGATPWNPFTTLLEELFRRNARGLSWTGKVEVLNAGVNGMKMEGIYNRLKDRVLALNPDLVILKPGWPDLVNIASAAMGTEQVSANRLILSLTRVSLLVVGMRSLAGKFLHGDTEWYWTRVDRDKMERLIQRHPTFSNYQEALAKSIRLLQGRDICFFLVTEPYKHDASHFKPPSRLYYMYPHSRLRKILAEEARRSGAPIADLETVLNEKKDKYLLFSDVVHMTGEGYDWVARYLYDEIIRNRYLQKCRSAPVDQL